MDIAMCAIMFRIQHELKGRTCTPEQLQCYIGRFQSVTRDEYFAIPEVPNMVQHDGFLRWQSPCPSGFSENDMARADIYLCKDGWKAPTVLLLHALMSASDFGYRRIAAWFNRHGWNAVFQHLPFHYSRTPRGMKNGALCVTGDLPLIGDTLRQGVVELRQLCAYLRARGCPEFGILATSYGGWVGALLSFVEGDQRFISLLQPIIDLEHAIWKNPTAASLRRSLRAKGIKPGDTLPLAHLCSPSHGQPLCPLDAVTIIGARYDRVSPPNPLQELSHTWTGSRFVEVVQGHFGYAAMATAQRQLAPIL